MSQICSGAAIRSGLIGASPNVRGIVFNFNFVLALSAGFSFEWKVKFKSYMCVFFFLLIAPFCREFFSQNSLKTLSFSLCFSSSLSVFLLCVHKSTEVIPQFCNAELLFSACCRVHNYIANLFLGYRLGNNLNLFMAKVF